MHNALLYHPTAAFPRFSDVILAFQGSELMNIKKTSGEVFVHLLLAVAEAEAEIKSLGALCAALSGVHSLFNSPSPVESDFHFCHASFVDFLSDQERSLQFYTWP
jgi:hypothetical protein